MTTKDTGGNDKVKAVAAKQITFKCKSCGKSRPVDEMNILNRFFPPLVVCNSCEKEML